MKTIVINGKRIAWKTVLALRKEQLAKAKKATQPALFELKHDARPTSQRKAAGRYSEPLLFEE